jgi:hypothetical protein
MRCGADGWTELEGHYDLAAVCDVDIMSAPCDAWGESYRIWIRECK